MGCLSDVKDELKAGQFAGKILCCKSTHERQDIYFTVPDHLKPRVDEIIYQYEGKQIERIGMVIASLKTKYERLMALSDVEEKLRERVKKFVIERFEKKREKGKASADIGEEEK
jgi:hypothetical protein